MRSIRSRLAADEWAAVRRRWEGDPREGFEWVAAEMRLAFGVRTSRAAVGQTARRRAWVKGGPASEPLTPIATVEFEPALSGKVFADPKRNLALPKRGPGTPGRLREIAAEMAEYFAVKLLDDAGQPRQVTLPTLQRFAASIGLSARELEYWASVANREGRPKYPEFARAYEAACEAQQALLIEGAAAGVFNPTFAAAVMTMTGRRA